VAKGAGDRNEFREIFVEISQRRIVFFPISLGGMTSGALGQQLRERERVPFWEERGNGPWAIFGTQAEVMPAALSSFSNSFLFSFLFLFENLCK
jgi:hypothetical protein